MKKIGQIIVAAVLVLLGIVAMVQTGRQRTQPIDHIYTISAAEEGKTLVTWYDEKNINVSLVNAAGKIKKSVSLPLEKGDLRYSVEASCIGEDRKVFLLVNSYEKTTGEFVGQDLVIYNFGKWFPGKTVIAAENLQLADETDEGEMQNITWRYHFVNASGEVLSLIGVNEEANLAVRRVFEFGEITKRSLNVKSERYYPLASGEGIYQAVGNGTDMVYISNSGKVFHATEEQVQEIYPAREVEVLMYPLYLAFAESGYVYIQDGESGDILKLNIEDGTEELQMSGDGSFSAAQVVLPTDICVMSMVNLNHFSAVVKNAENGGYRLFVVSEGAGYLTDKLVRPFGYLLRSFLGKFILYVFVTAAVAFAGYGIFRGITQGKTIMEKLMLAALPLMVLAMSAFGVTAYRYYCTSVVDSYEKQTVDEGNMMTALFGQESFDALEYPYDYSSESYDYLIEQMKGRKLYSRVVYFEDGELYTGVDENTPCFYPIGIQMNDALETLYKRAALSGQAVTGTIQDDMGERIVSVTPVGGTSGRSVYLYEAGVFTSVIKQYQSSYIKNFVWICIVFLVVVAVLLTAMFLRILQPLGEIRQGMELFTNGDRNIRIEPGTQDELAGICQTFNKMADDIDLQLITLQNLSDTYYRFMPLSIIGLLGKDNLGGLTLGSQIQGNYAVLSVWLRSAEKKALFIEREEEINRFFNLINTQAVRYSAIPIVDSANLSSMLLICKEGVASAIRTALAILAGVDAYNAGTEEAQQLDILFLLHRSDIFVGICGDDERYIPVLITPELENIMEQKEIFMEMNSRLLVTGQAYSELDEEEDFRKRYVGSFDIKDSRGGFYEFYDDRDAAKVHEMKVTDANFRKAMKLFEEGYLYEAKNLFAMVLRDNPDDLVAKYYIFRCE